MAVQSDTSRIQYAGNNSTTTSYAVPFVFQENSHLKAIARTSAGVESVVTLTNHTGAGNVNGGTVRTAVAVPATSTLTIYREVPATQTTTYAEGGDFPAASHERALDKLTQIAQQLDRKVGSAIRLSAATQLPDLNPPTANQQHILSSVGGAAPSWQALPSLSIGPVIATGSTTARSVQDRFADVVNVKDFGATGDNITDDTAAIQAAIDAANAAGGGIVFIPEGSYALSAPLTIGSKTTLRGVNPSASVLRWTNVAAGTTVAFPSQSSPSGRRGIVNKDYTNGNSFIVVEDLKLDFSWIIANDPATFGARQVVYFYNCDNTRVSRCHVVSDGGAVAHVNSRKYIVDGNYCEYTGTFNGSDGIIDQWHSSSDGIVANNFIKGSANQKWPILATSTTTLSTSGGSPMRNLLIYGNVVDLYKEAGIHIMGRIDGIENCRIVNNTVNGGSVAATGAYPYNSGIICSNSNGTVVSGNCIRNTPRCAIVVDKETFDAGYIAPSQSVTISGNIITNAHTTTEANSSAIRLQNVANVNVTSNIVAGGSYAHALRVTTANVSGETVSNNYFAAGSTGITNNAASLALKFFNASNALCGSVTTSGPSTGDRMSVSFGANSLLVANANGFASFVAASTTPNSVNRVQTESTDAGSSPVIRAQGGDTDLDIRLIPLGTGNVRYGTHAAITTETLAGFITIKDSAGNARKLAVVS